jgi:hypothetical protein
MRSTCLRWYLPDKSAPPITTRNLAGGDDEVQDVEGFCFSPLLLGIPLLEFLLVVRLQLTIARVSIGIGGVTIAARTIEVRYCWWKADWRLASAPRGRHCSCQNRFRVQVESRAGVEAPGAITGEDIQSLYY